MIPSHLTYLVCLRCKQDLQLLITEKSGNKVRSGKLICCTCHQSYPIVDFIPRFVSGQNNYSANFGYEWNIHWQTQFDKYSGLPISRDRFFGETVWGKELSGQIILEAGSGSGRFTEQAASTGAMIISFDYSNAVEANYRNNGNLGNVLIVQANIYEMPFKDNYFDKVFCIGVIQHTPDPEKAFICLSKTLKSKGNIAIDVYQKYKWRKQIFITRYYVRFFTKKMPHFMLYRFCNLWVDFWWPIIGLIARITGKRSLSRFLLIPDYRDTYKLSDKMCKEWAILDSFDMLSAAYDFPQDRDSVAGWFKKADLVNVEVNPERSLILGKGFKR